MVNGLYMEIRRLAVSKVHTSLILEIFFHSFGSLRVKNSVVSHDNLQPYHNVHVMLADHFHYNITRLTLPLVLPFSLAKCTNRYKAHKGINMMIIRVHASYFFWQKPKMDPFRITVHAIIPQTCIKVTFLQTEKVTVKQISLSTYSFPFPPSIQLIHLYIKKLSFYFSCVMSSSHSLVVVVSLSIFMWDTQELCYFTSDCRTLCTVSS